MRKYFKIGLVVLTAMMVGCGVGVVDENGGIVTPEGGSLDGSWSHIEVVIDTSWIHFDGELVPFERQQEYAARLDFDQGQFSARFYFDSISDIRLFRSLSGVSSILADSLIVSVNDASGSEVIRENKLLYRIIGDTLRLRLLSEWVSQGDSPIITNSSGLFWIDVAPTDEIDNDAQKDLASFVRMKL